MKFVLSACSLMALIVPGSVQAASVYPGCAVPSTKAGHRTFYVDPSKGSKGGDGSSAKPWRTLTEVLDTSSGLVATKGHNTRTFLKGDTSLVDINPKGLIKPGDVIMLMSGNHGDVRILNNYNSDFITVMAAPGQTPVISSMMVVSSAKWLFQGIKFQGQQPSASGGVSKMVSAGYGDWLGSTQDIVFASNSFSSTDDPSAWSPKDWVSKPYSYALYLAASSCTSATDNHIYNVMNGLVTSTNNSLIQGNVIERMANDGIDFVASNLQIKGNTIRDGVNDSGVNAFHADAIQGFALNSGGKTQISKNVTIDSNYILKTGSGKSNYLQGITVFDGLWDNIVISNNVVVTNTYQGISLSGAYNGQIVNNTVIGTDPSYGTWISVTRGNVEKSNVVVRNNVSTALSVLQTGFTVDHNIASVSLAYIRDNGLPARVYSGAWGTNKILPAVMNDFVAANSGTATYDLRPKASSVVVGYGTTDKAPLVDITGKLRKPTVSAGAYN